MTRLLVRLLALFHHRRLDAELADELSAHLDFATQENLARGLSAEDARRAAVLRLGGALQTAEAYRDQRGFPLLDSLAQDVRYALRGMRRSPGFTLIAVMTLAIGIGVNAAVFTLTSAMFKGFASIQGNDRILYVRTRETSRPQAYHGVSSSDFRDWSARATSFEGMAACRDVARISLSDPDGSSQTYWAAQVSANAFTVVGRQPVIGRNFTAADESAGAAPVAILTYGLWTARYAGDPAVVGRTLRINGAPTTVIGVMAEGFAFPNKQDLWMPLTAMPHSAQRDARDDLMFVFGRLKPGVTLETARADMQTIGRQLASAYDSTNRGFLPDVQPFSQFFHGSMVRMYEAMWGAVSFVLLIACANLANLLLARGVGRSREVSIRVALGAGRRRIIRQLLVESLVLSTVGGACGWCVARWSVQAYVHLAFAAYHPTASPDVYPWFDFSMDYRVLAYLIAISVATGALFGLAPARRLSRIDANGALQAASGRVVGGRGDTRVSAWLIAAEMAMAVVLLAGAAVMVRSVLNLYTTDIGVDTADMLTTRVELRCDVPFCAAPDDRYRSAEARISFFERLTTQLEAIPGVASVALASRPPAGGSTRLSYERSGAPQVDERDRPTIATVIVGPAYFRTLGVTLLAGREFTDADGAAGSPAAIVNQRFASEHWPSKSAIGERLRLFEGDTPHPWLTIVGVAPDIVQDALRPLPESLVYVPYRQRPAGAMTVIAHTRVPPESLAAPFRNAIQALDHELPVFDSQTLAAHLAGDYRFNYALLFSIFAGIALLLSSVGLYGVIAHSVSQRTRELGIRTALGATSGDILALVAGQGLMPVGIGLAVGLCASVGVNGVLRSTLVNVSPSDPIALLVTCIVLLASAALGCLVPARRAARTDPMAALRHD